MNELQFYTGLKVVSNFNEPLEFNGTLSLYMKQTDPYPAQTDLVLDTDYTNYAILYRCVTHTNDVSISRIMFRIHGNSY